MYTSLHQTHTSKPTSESTESKHSCLRLLTHDRTWTRDCRVSATQMFQEWCFFSSSIHIIAISLKKNWQLNTVDPSFVALLKHISVNKNKNGSQQIKSNEFYIKTMLKYQETIMFTTECLAVNWTHFRGRKWAWNNLPRIFYPVKSKIFAS